MLSYLVCVLMPAQPLQDSARGPRGELYIRKAAPPDTSEAVEKDPAGSRRERARGSRAGLQPAERRESPVVESSTRWTDSVGFSDFLGQGGELYLATKEFKFVLFLKSIIPLSETKNASSFFFLDPIFIT